MCDRSPAASWCVPWGGGTTKSDLSQCDDSSSCWMTSKQPDGYSLEQNPYLDALLRHRCHCYLTSPCWGWCLSPCLLPVASFTRGCQRKELDFTEESRPHALAVCNLKDVLVKDNAFASICSALFQRCWVKWRSVNTNRNGRFATSAALIQNTSIGRTACGVEVATSEYLTPPQPLHVVITTS